MSNGYGVEAMRVKREWGVGVGKVYRVCMQSMQVYRGGRKKKKKKKSEKSERARTKKYFFFFPHSVKR